MDQCSAFVPAASSVLEIALKTSGGSGDINTISATPYSMRLLETYK